MMAANAVGMKCLLTKTAVEAHSLLLYTKHIKRTQVNESKGGFQESRLNLLN